MKCLIISLHFSPGNFSHMIANYKLVNSCGGKAYLYVNRSFNKMDEDNQYLKINKARELKDLGKVDMAVFWSPSLLNIIEALRLKFIYQAKIVFICHEPFDSVKKYYDSGFRFKEIARICLVSLVNLPVIALSSKIILSSFAALATYQQKYSLLNKNFTRIPLLFDDEASGALNNNEKKFISYIGTIAADHAFDKFTNFMDSAIKNNWFPSLKFLIATSSAIPEKQRTITDRCLQSGDLVISENHAMNNSEINHYYSESLVVWNAYNRSMQSGVLPKAYMFGAAVIALSRNTNEFVDDHKTGIIISDNNDMLEIKEAIDEIALNRALFFSNCRERFLNTFYYKLHKDVFLSTVTARIIPNEFKR